MDLYKSQFTPGGEGGSSLSVLRTFRLLRILKLVRFLPNLRRQLLVMLKTMDNVAIFFSLLILFIFIFRYDFAACGVCVRRAGRAVECCSLANVSILPFLPVLVCSRSRL